MATHQDRRALGLVLRHLRGARRAQQRVVRRVQAFHHLKASGPRPKEAW